MRGEQRSKERKHYKILEERRIQGRIGRMERRRGEERRGEEEKKEIRREKRRRKR